MTHERPPHWRPGRKSSDRARRAAFDCLVRVNEGAYANIELPHILARRHLDKRDAAFATHITYGTLRLQGRLDAVIAHCADRPLSSLDQSVLIVLRLGAYQLLELDTPPHAALNETVMLARNEVGSGASGFVNAVLRRVSEKSTSEWRDIIAQESRGNTHRFLARWLSHPEWIISAYQQTFRYFGRSTHDIPRLLQANNTPPPVALVARGISTTDLSADIARGHMHSAPGILVDSAVLLRDGDPGRVFAVQDRLAAVQDEGSQLVARTVAAAPVDGPDDLWLDLCAGPGGKTATMAAFSHATINANELHEHRLDLVADSVEPWADRVNVRCGDGRDMGSEEPDTYDRVLIDAPCTGIGAVRRRPEARWHKDAGDALDLAILQGELLESGWQATRPGGIVAYCTCSPYMPETVDVVEKFLSQHDDAELLNAPRIAAPIALQPLSDATPYLQLWPDQQGCDALFLALISKNV